MQKNLNKWREAASLIVASKIPFQNTNGFNYKILTMKRSPQTSFLPQTVVFPGGSIDKIDNSSEWAAHFESFGFSKSFFSAFMERDFVPPMMQDNNYSNEGIPRCISLRISAIRETFEETGFLICKSKKVEKDPTEWSDFFGSNKMQKWQHEVHDDPARFLSLCKELEIYPDVWALHDWSNWLTPTFFPKRFDTIFFIAMFSQIPETFLEPTEAEELIWENPPDYLKLAKHGQIFLPPPQVYEFSRLLNFQDFATLETFARERSKAGIVRYLPIPFKTENGIVSILPGDELYPSNVEVYEISQEDILPLPQKKYTRVHRMLHFATKRCEVQILNIKPHANHKPPLTLLTAQL